MRYIGSTVLQETSVIELLDVTEPLRVTAKVDRGTAVLRSKTPPGSVRTAITVSGGGLQQVRFLGGVTEFRALLLG